MLAVDERGEAVDGDAILAVLALDLGVDLVAVTQMTNLGFHRLMAERGIRVVTTDVGDRYVLEALKREGGVLGGEQSGHIIYLEEHVTGDGLAAALLLCRALGGRKLSRSGSRARALSAGDRRTFPSPARSSPSRSSRRSSGSTRSSAPDGRVLVRPSGTEPVVRVLAEASAQEKSNSLCASIAALVAAELG